jgi:predicted ATPase
LDNYIIITGGPGAGKTTLIDALEMLGHRRTVEAGRFIIQAQAEIGGTGVHFGDQKLFAELMLMHEIRSYEEQRGAPGLVFFDRGVPELVGYLPMVGRTVPQHFKVAAEIYRYNPTVFVAPPWREIFANDAERKQDWAEAVDSYEWCVKTYRDTGYDLVELPRASVADRVRFVLGRVAG